MRFSVVTTTVHTGQPTVLTQRWLHETHLGVSAYWQHWDELTREVRPYSPPAVCCIRRQKRNPAENHWILKVLHCPTLMCLSHRFRGTSEQGLLYTCPTAQFSDQNRNNHLTMMYMNMTGVFRISLLTPTVQFFVFKLKSQVVSCRLPNAAAPVRANVRSHGICGGQSGTRAG